MHMIVHVPRHFSWMGGIKVMPGQPVEFNLINRKTQTQGTQVRVDGPYICTSRWSTCQALRTGNGA